MKHNLPTTAATAATATTITTTTATATTNTTMRYNGQDQDHNHHDNNFWVIKHLHTFTVFMYTAGSCQYVFLYGKFSVLFLMFLLLYMFSQ